MSKVMEKPEIEFVSHQSKSSLKILLLIMWTQTTVFKDTVFFIYFQTATERKKLLEEMADTIQSKTAEHDELNSKLQQTEDKLKARV